VDNKKKDDLRDVIREETSRGRRRVDIEARRERARMLREMRDLLAIGTEEDFLKAMHAAGFAVNPRNREDLLRIWREHVP
jgi:hypothetical protein